MLLVFSKEILQITFEENLDESVTKGQDFSCCRITFTSFYDPSVLSSFALNNDNDITSIAPYLLDIYVCFTNTICKLTVKTKTEIFKHEICIILRC